MVELKKEWRPDQFNKYISTKKGNLSDRVTECNGTSFGVKITPNSLGSILRKEFIPIETLISLDSETTPGLEKGFDFAKDGINNLQDVLGLPRSKPEEMKIIPLSRSKFIRYYRSISSSTERCPSGFCADMIQPVVIMKQTVLPEYFLASIAFHELIHKNFESNVKIFNSIQKSENKHRTVIESRRYGLAVHKIKNDAGSVKFQNETGNLLNELPNYMYQKGFIDAIFENEESRNFFSSEIKKREELLKNYFIEGVEHTQITTEEGESIIFHKSLFHFDKKGRPLFLSNNLAFLIMQLARDLGVVCKEINGKPFWEVFLKAKIDPKIQIKIKHEIDSKFGEGLYQEIKTADYYYEDVLPILVQVQKKLYPF